MELELLGPNDRPAVATLGTWDPFLPQDEARLQRLARHAERKHLASVAIMLEPAPPLYIDGRETWIVYHDLETRIRLLRETGVDCVAVVHFGPDDLRRTCADFFTVICGAVALKEFWLKHRQTIGPGQRGGPLAIRVQSVKHGWQLTQLPADGGGAVAATVREDMTAGRLRHAVRAVGRPPSVARPAMGRARVAWPAGEYLATTVEASRAFGSGGEAVTIEVGGGDTGMREFDWPATHADHLWFTAGPADGARVPAAVATA